MNPKGGSGTNVAVRNQATVTDPLHSVEIGTSTRVETAEVAVSTSSELFAHLAWRLDENNPRGN